MVRLRCSDTVREIFSVAVAFHCCVSERVSSCEYCCEKLRVIDGVSGGVSVTDFVLGDPVTVSLAVETIVGEADNTSESVPDASIESDGGDSSDGVKEDISVGASTSEKEGVFDCVANIVLEAE